MRGNPTPVIGKGSGCDCAGGRAWQSPYGNPSTDIINRLDALDVPQLFIRTLEANTFDLRRKDHEM